VVGGEFVLVVGFSSNSSKLLPEQAVLTRIKSTLPNKAGNAVRKQDMGRNSSLCLRDA